MTNKQLLEENKLNSLGNENMIKLLKEMKANLRDKAILERRLSNGVSIREFCSILIEDCSKLEDVYHKIKMASSELPEKQVDTKEWYYIDEGIINEFRDTIKNQPRETAIFELFLCTGIRIGEVAALRIDNVDFLNQHVIIKTKTRSRIIPLSDDCIWAIGEYLEYRSGDSEYLFVSDKGVPLREDQIVNLIRRKSPRVGFEYIVTPRTLRKTFVFNLISKKVPPELIGEYLGVNPKFLPHLLEGMIYR